MGWQDHTLTLIDPCPDNGVHLTQLEVIAQLMDYALFFRSYRDKLWPIIAGRLQPKSRDIACYVVNNHFHSRFDDVIEFYSTKKGSYGFRMIKVVLGQYLEK